MYLFVSVLVLEYLTDNFFLIIALTFPGLHQHSLDGDFHIDTPSGVLSVAYVRAVRGFQTILFQIVFSVIPTALELFMVYTAYFSLSHPTFKSVFSAF